MIDSHIMPPCRLNIITKSPENKKFGQPADIKQCSVEGPGFEELTVHIRGSNGQPIYIITKSRK